MIEKPLNIEIKYSKKLFPQAELNKPRMKNEMKGHISNLFLSELLLFKQI